MQAYRTRDYRLAAGVFVGVWLLLSAPWLSGMVTIPYDAKALFQAQLQFLANALHTGQSPLWNPSSFGGMPQIADPQSLIFSPAFLLAYLTKSPSFWLLDTFVLVLLAAGGLATLKFCQDRGWHPAGCAVAAIVFAFGASTAWRIQHIAQIQSLAFFAVALWLLGRALAASSALYGALAGLAAGLMVIEPNQVALLGCYVLAGYCVAHWLLSCDVLAAVRRSLAPLAAGALVTTSMALLPLLSIYLFLDASNRPSIAFSEAVRGSLHPASLLTAVVADLFGAIDPATDYWGPYSEWWDKNELTLSYNMSQMYLGTLPILLILTVGLTRGTLWAREIRALTVATMVLLLYALGTHTPMFRIFFDYLPGVAFFRRPVDATFLIGALIAIAAGYIVHLWASGTLPLATTRRRCLEAGLIAAILAAALATAATAGKAAAAGKPLLVALAWMAVTLLVLAVPKAWRQRSRPFAVIAPALLLAVDLAVNNGPNVATALPPANYEILTPATNNDTVRFLKERLRREPGSPWRDRVELVGLGFEWQNAALVHGFEGTLGYNPFRLGEVSEATGAGDYSAGADQKAFSPLFPSYTSTMADLLGLRFIVVGVPIEHIDHKLMAGLLHLVARTADAFIYENPHALPRVLFASNWRRVDFEMLTASGRWPPFDPKETVLLEEAPEFDKKLVRLARHSSIRSSVSIRHYENTKVVIDVDAVRSGFIVLHDVWHPWWTAELNGRDVPVLRANVMFRAVRVPAGRHVLTFEFKPIAGAITELSGRLFAPPAQQPPPPSFNVHAKGIPLPRR
ncbi:MAG: YfhO family protein [Hyphomonadaceae bacterium]|nr:YfhO family protein [Hyphomonadaceae bacterium]